MLKHCSHYSLGNGEPRTLPSPHIMALLALIIHLSRGEKKQKNYFGFPWLCLFLGAGLHRNHLSTPVTFMMSLIIIFFIQKPQNSNAFPVLVYFTQRNSNCFFTSRIVSLGRLIWVCVSIICVYQQSFSTKMIPLVTFTDFITMLAKCFPVTNLFSFTGLSSNALPSFSEKADAQS